MYKKSLWFRPERNKIATPPRADSPSDYLDNGESANADQYICASMENEGLKRTISKSTIIFRSFFVPHFLPRRENRLGVVLCAAFFSRGEKIVSDIGRVLSYRTGYAEIRRDYNKTGKAGPAMRHPPQCGSPI